MEQINTVDDYLKRLSTYDIYNNVFYRGQLEVYKSITPSVSRNAGYAINEYFIYDEAINMKSVEFANLLSPIERLSKMQHYGIPTRLVDLTVDPLIALFFAVQNIDDKSHGNVYVFVQPEYSLNDKRIKLLSLLATSESYNLDLIKSSYLECYSEKITEDEILEFASEGAFVKYSVELQKSNERLFCQKGSFAICGNETIDKEITKSILPLDSIEPTMVIRIPFEHKQAVKKVLDEKYNINETTIYPEFPSVADYLKEKYRKIDFDLDGTYNILQVQDVLHAGVRRCSIVAVLNKVLRIEEVKKIGVQIINQYRMKNDVVWVYIAKNGDDYIMKNWMIIAQWIRESLDPSHKPLLIGKADELGYIWRFEKSYSTLTEYYDEYAFVDDKLLFTQNMKALEELEPRYKYMLHAFESGEMKELEKYTFDNASVITNFFLEFSDYGQSRNNEFNEYLNNFQGVALQLDNVILWLKKEELNSGAKRYQISNCFRDAKIHFDTIKDQAIYWKRAIDLSDDEYNEIDPEKIKRKENQYKQTIPINQDGLDVTFNLDISRNSDNTVYIRGRTNLFDKASLMISLRNSNDFLLAQNKSLVENGRFDFGRLGKKDIGLDKGKYKVDISLAIPSVQNKEFLLKSGIEYENLKGKYIDRTGMGPTVSYTEEFEF
ncbi:FRG domain-containing protein [Rossellomorea vietnamensis]|uniref:FRG domain-containing protein n=1 Tax=Rossellomorea vietnamensis TaxID=218284 RepID=UPI001E507981|nr:FRG domain-containing protein [Rossellomorea vietnamensis]MCC5801841.1 FRG domain-containing protein [Rossellomorea vietnamensis]